jgi:hypothetical protein
MIDASVLPIGVRGRAHPPAAAGADAYAATGAELAAARRAVNRARNSVALQLCCECTRQRCRESFPALAERHRGRGDRFIVVPAHVDHGIVVRAADEFFVVRLRPAARPKAGTNMTGMAARGDRSSRLDTDDACPRRGHIEELGNFRLASLIGEAVDLKERLDALEARLWAPRSPELRLVPDTACDAASSLHGPIETPQSTKATPA